MTGLIDAASAILLSSEKKVEASASNIANSSTNGFKRNAGFSEILQANQSENLDLPRFQQATDFSQGQLTLSGNPLDIAIYGPGFFQLRDGDQIVYSRGGSFHLAEGGRLADAADRLMQAAGGGDLTTSGGELEILDDGTVLEDGLPIGTLALWEAGESVAAQAIGGSLFDIEETALTEASRSQVRQGFVEGSNVLMSDEMVEMMAAVRQAESGGRIVQVYDQLMDQAVPDFQQERAMNGAFAISAAALRAEQQAMETHANNVANVNTPGFKKQQNQFTEVMAETTQAANEARAVTGLTVAPGAGVRVRQSQMLFEQGALRPTGNALDIAIDGRGFIELLGTRGQALLWRGGTLRVNDDGQLATSSGIPLRTTIAVPVDAAGLTISANGVVTAVTASGEAIELGQITLVSIEHEGAVERLDGGLLRLLPDASSTDLSAAEDGAGRLVQGSLEESNVELTEEMVQMMIVQRAYAANAQIVQAADQLASITNNLKR